MLGIVSLVFIAALGVAKWFPHNKSAGIFLSLPTATCSAELLDRPLIFRVLPNGQLALGTDIMPKQLALARLPGIAAASSKRTLLFYADTSLSFQEVAEILSDLPAELPRWDIFLITPDSRQPCDQWLNAHSGPAV